MTVARCQYFAVAENRRTSRALARRLNARPTADRTMLAVKSGWWSAISGVPVLLKLEISPCYVKR